MGRLQTTYKKVCFLPRVRLQEKETEQHKDNTCCMLLKLCNHYPHPTIIYKCSSHGQDVMHFKTKLPIL
jgi:hypothetical protein